MALGATEQQMRDAIVDEFTEGRLRVEEFEPQSDSDYDFFILERTVDRDDEGIHRPVEGMLFYAEEIDGQFDGELVIVNSNVPKAQRDSDDLLASNHWKEWGTNPRSVGADSSIQDSFRKDVLAWGFGLRQATAGDVPRLNLYAREVSR